MQGRQTYVDFRGTKSKYRKVKLGVPQGGVLSPLLFNLYLRNIPQPPAGIELVSYADDCTILTTGNHIPQLSQQLNGYLHTVSEWLKDQYLELSPGKSSATLFTLWTHETNHPLEIAIDNTQVPINKNPKILGVTFDPTLTFHRHATNIKNKLQARNNVLKTIAGSTWGKDKETLSLTYKAIGRPIANYAAPIFAPQLRPTNWKKIQRAQNASLRAITGCHVMASEDHLHQETNILPIKEHTVLLAAQYALKCHQPSHPNYDLVYQPAPPRQIRKTAITKYKDCVNLLPPPTSTRRLRRGTKIIHTAVVNETNENLTDNRVLKARPPIINPEETSLARTTRSTLAQLRSGWCKKLKSYQAKIDEAIPDICPECGASPHDVEHLFNCPRHPTEFTTHDLWNHPVEVSEFLDINNPDD